MRTSHLGALFLVGISLTACGGGGSSGGSATVNSIIISAPSTAVAIGNTVQFTATAKDSSGNPISGVSFTWASSNTSAVTINGSGLATGVAGGKTQITATASGVTSNSLKLLAGAATSVSGTVAHGAAITDATLTLEDANGNQATATTNSSGSYSITTTGMTPPFLVQVTNSGITLYSVSADTSTSSIINVTPLTDLIVRTWYSVQGSNVTAGFASPATMSPPSPTEVQLISNVVVQVMSLWLQNAGVNTTNFSPIDTAFTPNGSGEDAVLAETTINTNTGAISVSGSVGGTSVTQDSTLANSGSSVTVTTTTSGGGDTSTSTNTSTIPASSAEQAALAGINADLAGIANTINSKGANLAASDLSPYLDPGLLWDGLNESQQAGQVATSLRGLTASIQLSSINSLDTTNNVADVNVTLTETQSQNSRSETQEFFFREVNGSWLLSGDQRIAKVTVQAEFLVNEGTFAPGGPNSGGPAGTVINTDVQPLQGAVTGITVTGATAQGAFNNSTLQQGATIADTYTPTPGGSSVTVNLDHFFLLSPTLTALPPAGTPISFTLNEAAGGTANYSLPTNAFTDEGVSITAPSGSAIASLTLGSPVTVSWTLPKTYAVAQVKIIALAFTGPESSPSTFECNVDGPILPVTATSGQITVPTTCNGQGVVNVSLNLNVIGVDGEQSNVVDGFQ